jgi:hypothetical protein
MEIASSEFRCLRIFTLLTMNWVGMIHDLPKLHMSIDVAPLPLEIKIDQASRMDSLQLLFSTIKDEEDPLIHNESHQTDENSGSAFDPLRCNHSPRQQYKEHNQGDRVKCHKDGMPDCW